MKIRHPRLHPSLISPLKTGSALLAKRDEEGTHSTTCFKSPLFGVLSTYFSPHPVCCRCTLDVHATRPASGTQTVLKSAPLRLPTSPFCRTPFLLRRKNSSQRDHTRYEHGVITPTRFEAKRQDGWVPPGEERAGAVKTTPRVRRKKSVPQVASETRATPKFS